MVDFVLEFFLPVDCKNHEDQKGVLNSLLIIIQKVCRSLKIIMDMELQEEADNEELFVIPDTELVPKAQEIAGPGPGPGSGSGLGGSGSGLGVEKRRAGAKMEKTITIETLRQHFAGSLKDAAKHIGVCPTTLKRICRQHGIQRWPSRKIKKVSHSLKKIQLVMESVHGGSGSFRIESFYSNFPKLASSDLSKTIPMPFSASKIKTFDSKAADGATAATSCSQSSSSSQSCSGGTRQVPQTGKDTGDGVLKRTKSDAEIHAFCASSDQDQETKLFPRSHSHKSLNELPKSQNLPPKLQITPDGDLRRVKVTFGEEKVRFRMQKDWGYNELLQEIAKRFSLNDICGYHLKYLDDDSEWVLLTCDADLEECMDVYRSCKTETIRLALREPQLRVGSSFGSNTPL